MKQIYLVNKSKAALGLFSGVKSRITLTQPLLNHYCVLTVALMLLLGGFSTRVWGYWHVAYYCSADAYVKPANTGYVWVTVNGTSFNGSFSQGEHDGSSHSDKIWGGGFWDGDKKAPSNYSITAQFYAQATNGDYKFKGWYNNVNGTGAALSTSTSNNCSYSTTISATKTSPGPNLKLYAIYAKYKTTTTQIDFGEVAYKSASRDTTFTIDCHNVGEWSSPSGLSGVLSASLSGNSNNNTQQTCTVTVTLNPTATGVVNQTLTVTTSRGGSIQVTVKANISAVPNYTWKSDVWNTDGTMKRDVYVGETIFNVVSSTSEGDIEYTISNWTPSGTNNTGGSIPTFTDNTLYCGHAGTLTLNINQAAEANGYKAGNSSINITIKKRANALSCSWGNNVWTKTAHFDENVAVQVTATNTNYTSTAIQISQTKGANIATLARTDATNNTLTASHFTGYATWHFSQPEDYKYLSASADLRLDVGVEATEECAVFYDGSEHTFTTGITDFSGHFDTPIDVTSAGGVVDKLYFKAKKDAENYFVAQYSVDNGSSWRDIVMPDLTNSYKTYGPYNFPNLQANEMVTHLRFGAKTGGTWNKWYKDITITRKTHLLIKDANDAVISTLNVSDKNTMGNTVTASFYVDYSTCDDVINIKSNDSHFTVNTAQIEANGDNTNHPNEIVVSYTSATPGSHTGTITIYNDYYNITLTVTGTTLQKTQTIEWQDGFTTNPLSLPIGFTTSLTNLAAVSSWTDNPIVYSSDDETVVAITLGGLGFEVVGDGTATLTASAAGNDEWYAAEDTKTIVATNKKIQEIIWNQDFVRTLVLDSVVDLDAKVYLRNVLTGELVYNSDRTALITYECPTDNGVITVAGKQMTVIGYGSTTITAKVVGDEDYEAAAPYEMAVIVREPSTGCATPLVLDHSDNVQLFSMDMDLTNWTTPEISSTPIYLDTKKGKPDKLSYQHNGELYKVPGSLFDATSIKLCRGTVKAQQRVNGIWVDVEGSSYNNGGKEGSEGGYTWRPVENLQLSENADAIRFVRLTAGQGYHNFKNIQITKKHYFIASADTIKLGDITVGEKRDTIIGFDYSDMKGDLLATKSIYDTTLTIANNGNIYDIECGSHGHYNLPISLLSKELGAIEDTVTITDELTHDAITVIVQANVTLGTKYIFQTEGAWTEESNWKDEEIPGVNDDVVVLADVEISGNITVNSMTVAEGATVTLNVGGSLTLGSGNTRLLEEYGNLHIKTTGQVNVGSGVFIVNDFMLDAALGNASDTANGTSGQLNDAYSKMYLQHDAYFQMSFDPNGKISYGWYDFVVPFEVDVLNGIYDENFNKLTNGVDYLVMEYSEAKRAANTKDWTLFTGTMQPGRVYTITFEETKVWNTFIFKKKQGSSLSGANTFNSNYTNVSASQNCGWNGLGNGTLRHAQLTGTFANTKIQLYDHTANVYRTREASDYKIAIGTSFFIQVNGNQSIELTNNVGSRPLLAPSHEDRVVDEFCLSLTEEGSSCATDRLWVSASEEATGEYVIGHDLLKMGTPTQAKVAQIWTVRNDLRLCDNEMILSGSNATCDLGIYAPKSGSYVFQIEKAPEDAMLYLTYEGRAIWNLSYSPYVFDLAKGTTEGYGLKLYANPAPQVATGVDEMDAEAQTMRKVMIDNVLYIITLDGAMYDVTGKSVK